MGELRAILPYFRPYLRSLYWGVVLVFFATLFQMAGPYLIKLALDGMEDTDPDTAAARIATYAGLIVATAFVGGAARYGMRELLNGMSRRSSAICVTTSSCTYSDSTRRSTAARERAI